MQYVVHIYSSRRIYISATLWSASGNEPGHTHLNKIDVVELMAAAVKVLKKKKRDQDATGIPPPWMGLN